ncbi:MAG: hypothetical protein ABI780_05480 [Ardenticatenales bacterium]
MALADYGQEISAKDIFGQFDGRVVKAVPLEEKSVPLGQENGIGRGPRPDWVFNRTAKRLLGRDSDRKRIPLELAAIVPSLAERSRRMRATIIANGVCNFEATSIAVEKIGEKAMLT